MEKVTNAFKKLGEYLKQAAGKEHSLEIGAHYLFGRSLIRFDNNWSVVVDQFEIIISDKNQEFAIINGQLTEEYTMDKNLMETLADVWDIEVYSTDECTIGFRLVR